MTKNEQPVWRDKNGKLALKVVFNNFDEAWEFLHFVAKLSRSTNLYPEIYTRDNVAVVRVETDKSDRFREGLLDYLSPQKDNKVVASTTVIDTAHLYTDGGSRGNPGASASGFVIYAADDQELARGGEYLGITTNNQAEYHSLKLGLESALEHGVVAITVHMDSQLVVNQIKGVYKVKNRDLWPLYESCKKLLQEFESYTIVHIPRELNKVADGMVNKILDDNA